MPRCKTCLDDVHPAWFAKGHDICKKCGGGVAMRCPCCDFHWAVGKYIDPAVGVCDMCVERGRPADTDPIKPDDHVVYFMRAGDHVKIGFTLRRTLQKRLESVQVGNPLPVRIIGIEPGSRLREQELHQKWDDYRIRGEWFAFPGPISRYARSLRKP